MRNASERRVRTELDPDDFEARYYFGPKCGQKDDTKMDHREI